MYSGMILDLGYSAQCLLRVLAGFGKDLTSTEMFIGDSVPFDGELTIGKRGSAGFARLSTSASHRYTNRTNYTFRSVKTTALVDCETSTVLEFTVRRSSHTTPTSSGRNSHGISNRRQTVITDGQGSRPSSLRSSNGTVTCSRLEHGSDSSEHSFSKATVRTSNLFLNDIDNYATERPERPQNESNTTRRTTASNSVSWRAVTADLQEKR